MCSITGFWWHAQYYYQHSQHQMMYCMSHWCDVMNAIDFKYAYDIASHSAFLYFLYPHHLIHDIHCCGIIWTVRSCSCQSLGPVFPRFWQTKCHSRGTGTGCSLMTIFTVCWISGSTRAPTWEQFEQFDLLDRLRQRERARERLLLGCFCRSRQADKKAANVTRWMVSPSSASVCCLSSAVKIRLQSLFHDFLHSSCFFPQIGYHGNTILDRQSWQD